MPDEKNVIYCVHVDDDGRVVNTSMLTTSCANYMLESAKLIDNRLVTNTSELKTSHNNYNLKSVKLIDNRKEI